MKQLLEKTEWTYPKIRLRTSLKVSEDELASAEHDLKNTGGVSFTTQAFPDRIGRKQKCVAGLNLKIKDKFRYFAFGSV